MPEISLWILGIFVLTQASWQCTSALPAYSNLTMTVDVPFGKSAILDFSGILRHLETSLNNETIPRNRCRIRVLTEEPIYSRVGFMELANFSCWPASAATYTHLGFESPNEDVVKFRMSYHSPTDFIEHTLFAVIRILDRGAGNLILKGFPLRVNQRSSGVEAAKFGQHGISRKSILLSRDDFPDSCHIHVEANRTPFPRFGRLNIGPGGVLTCGQFFSGEIHYQLSADIFSNHDLIVLRAESLGEDATVSWEYFQMTVQIEGGQPNSPPAMAFASLNFLDVQNFVITSVSREVLLAEDKDGVADNLVYHVTQAPALTDGFLVRLDDPLHPIESFTQGDVNSMKIAFRPPVSDADQDRILESLILEIVDVEGLISDAVALVVVVKPASYSAPFVIFNKGLTLYEGEAATLWSSKNLAIADEDNLDEVRVRIVSGLAHGRLLKEASSVKEFVAADLQTGILRYQHDGSDTTADSLVLQMNDGQHQVEFLLPIIIIPVDDEPPVLLANTGILLQIANHTVPITSKILRAKDFDSNDEAIRYTLNSSIPWGSFFLINGESQLEVQSWTESDIVQGHLFYRHRGNERQITRTWYTVDFTLADNHEPPNLSPHLHVMTVTFVPLDSEAPYLSSSATMVLHVNASQVAIIGNGILHFVDEFTRDKDLLLIVRAGPSLGRLIWTDASGHRSDEDIPELFPQSYLAYSYLSYQAPSLPIVESDASAAPLQDSLVVDVRDKQGNTLKGQELKIFVEAPRARKPRFSQKPPAVVSKLVVVKQASKISLADYLLISDPDTDLSAIHLQIAQAPIDGTLLLNNKSLTVSDHFTAEDVQTGRLIYQNIQTPAHWEDFVRFNVSDEDSQEKTTAELHFRVIPSRDQLRSRKSKLGLSKLGLVIQVTEGSEFILTRTTLLGSADSGGYPPNDLAFQLEFPSRNGVLLLNGSRTDGFTWKDVEQHLVVYRSAGKLEEEENTIFDDALSFRVLPASDEWVLNEKVIDHLEIQILLTPRSATITVGKHFVVEEGQSNVLSEEHLVIVAPPNQRVNCSLVQTPLYGQLYDIIKQEIVRQFSSLEIAEHRIHFQQNLHMQVEPRTDSIKLSCAGNWVEIPVTITPTNDEPPIIMANHLHVSMDDHVLLGAFVSLMDADEPSDNLTIDIIQFPQHGLIIGNFTEPDSNDIQIEPAFRPIRSFLASDLLEPERIFYRHDGSRSFSDEFILRVSDGVHAVEKIIQVTIHEREEGPADDDPNYGFVEIISSPVELVGAEPEIRFYNSTNITNAIEEKFSTSTVAPPPKKRTSMPNITFMAPVKALILLPSKHLGVILNSDVVKIERDNSSVEKELLFEIVKPPKNGVFLDLREPDRIINVFTETSLQHMDVAYALFPENEDAIEDTFEFQAINEFGKRSKIFQGHFRWSWISFAVDKYETNEMMGVVTVGVRRRGWLQNRDFVAIKARDLTATMGRDYKEDFVLQAEFQPGQGETFVEIKILKDEQYEDREYFQLVLEEPQLANVEKPFVTTITISDQDDGAMIYIPLPLYFIQENVGIYNLTLKRSGKDLLNPLSVICYTTDGTASGTISRHQQIFRPDFVSRLNIHSSAVTFAANETTQVCPIVIVDDPFAETDERLFVNIRSLGQARLGIYQQTELVILRDPDDEPSISFSKNEYSTTIFDPFVELQVDRKGGDLNQPSEVDIMSEEGKRIEAVYFGPGESTQTVVLKSLGNFKLFNDIFRVYLNNSQYAQIPLPKFASIHVKKSMNLTMLSSMDPEGGLTENEIVLLGNYDGRDKPNLPVPEAEYECINCDKSTGKWVKSSGASKVAPPVHSSNKTAVIKQQPPKVTSSIPSYQLITSWKDNFNNSMKPKHIKFYSDSKEEKKVDDSWKDGMLDTAPKSSPVAPVMRGASLIPKRDVFLQRKMTSQKTNASTIAFAKAHYDVFESLNNHQAHWLSVLIVRSGDLAGSDSVRVITKNGSARSGQDFETFDNVVNFAANRSQEIIQVRILQDNEREPNENFTVHLYPLRRTLADVTKSMTTVTIQEAQSGGNFRFPGAPLVTSLENYERPVPGGWVAIGQPVICVTTCNPRHPDYARTSRVCDMEGIDDSQTEYSWKISHPLDDSLTLEPLQFIRSAAWFADVNQAVLDGIYYTNGSIVQCSARAVTKNGQAGFESTSEIVTAVSMDTQCPYSKGRANTVNIDPYQANISNMKNGDVKLSVTIPHRTGLVPLISTARITDLHLMLSGEGTRTAEHLCSNMISGNELKTTDGFLKYRPWKNRSDRTALEKLRGNKTLEFTQNLDLNNCQWNFETTYSMSEIINFCGGKLIADNTLRPIARREVSIQLPLFVTYAYFTNAVGQPWKHFDQSTTLDIVFSYNSALTWSPEPAAVGPAGFLPNPPSALAGPDVSISSTLDTPFPTELKVLQVKIDQDSHHMNVRFKTKPKFRGKFVSQDSRLKITAKVIYPMSASTEFELKLLRTQENSPQPQQLWRFRTLRAAKMNYLGMYNISLLPCEYASDSTTDCTVQPPVVFNVYISDQ